MKPTLKCIKIKESLDFLPALSVISRVTIGNLVNLSESLISHLYTGEDTRSVSFRTSSEFLLSINEVLQEKRMCEL